MQAPKDTLRALSRSIVSDLEAHKSIVFPVRLRNVIQDEVHALIAPFILTDDDLHQKTLARIEAKAEQLENNSASQSAYYQAAHSVVRAALAQDPMNGFYFQKTPKQIAHSIAQYLMRSSHIDDVFETDEDLENLIVDCVKRSSA